MSRGIGEFEAIQGVLPEWLALVLATATQLGDVWFLSLLLAVVYWRYPARRERVAVVSGLMLTGFAVVFWLKGLFALPRPDSPFVAVESLPAVLQPLYAATGTASGYGFPSGHAFMTTIVYLSLADTLAVGRRRDRYAAAIGLIALVCFTRVALGVHYLVDVVAGVALGAVVLVGFGRLMAVRETDRGTIAFGIAVLTGGLTLLASGFEPDAFLLAGAALGAAAGWQLVVGTGGVAGIHQGDPSDRWNRGRIGVAAAVVVGFIAALVGTAITAPAGRGAIVGLIAVTVLVAPVARRSAWTAGSPAEVGTRLARSVQASWQRGGERLREWLRS